MFASLFLGFRILAVWALTLVVGGFLWSGLFSGMDEPPGWIYGLLAMTLMVFTLSAIVGHVRRVSLIADRLDAQTLGNRHRRQVELPLDAATAFRVLEEVIGQMPRLEGFERSVGTLQLRALQRRADPYGDRPPSRWNLLARLAIKRNQITARVTPGTDTSSVTLLFEPDAGAWVDLLLLDEGSNFENAEAVTHALSGKVAEQRREERAQAARTEAEKELTVARLNLLHAQVEPHFLYNTLANAQVLTRADPERAEQMLGHLIHYLRSSLPGIDQSVSTLGQELERVHAYLEILRIRMGARLTLQVDVPEALHHVALPSMSLQTLVENAIKHGLEPKSGGGTVWILARELGGQLTVTVADDGQGITTHSSGTGIGLKNLRERLRLTCGEQASLAMVSNFPSGVAATISLPYVASVPPPFAPASVIVPPVPEYPHVP
ncbi:MAG: sensor histidine kinase [Stenotrophomonas sp.]|uniref:sensor histidine kinase n=1 Tax=Stenotrophomonas sp. TaxID=69392 RepID=UPI003D6D2840